MTTITPLPVLSGSSEGPESADTPTDEQLRALSDHQVADQLTTWAGRVAAGEARLLRYLGEFDRRQAWAEPGMLSCAHWMSWRLGMGLTAAYERVRVASALRELPATATAFAAGQVSWTQVRAITRVADRADEQIFLDLARHASGSQLERLTRGVRRARRAVEDARDPEAARCRMRTKISYDEDGTMVLTTRLPAEQGALVLAALEQARADLDAERRAAHAEPAAPRDSAEPANAERANARSAPAAGCGKLSSAEDSAGSRVGDPADDQADDQAGRAGPVDNFLPRKNRRSRAWRTGCSGSPATSSTGAARTGRRPPGVTAPGWWRTSTRSRAGPGCPTASCSRRRWRQTC